MQPKTNSLKDLNSFTSTDFNKIGLNKSNLNFCSYLAGLIEGDGTIVVPTTERSEKGKINYPSIQIVFNSKDLPLALIIQQRLGMGSLSKRKGANAYIFTINNYEGLLLVASLINGHMRTPKIHALWNLIDWLNVRFKDLNMIKNPIDNSLLTSNSWLTGFIEANGRFSVKVLKNEDKLSCNFELIQMQTNFKGGDLSEIMLKLSEFLLSNLKETKINTKNKGYRVRTTSLNENLNLKEYLNNFPLFSSKYLDYLDFLEVLQYFINKEHYNNVDKIIRIKSNMYNNRTYFNWDHLQNFYTLNNFRSS